MPKTANSDTFHRIFENFSAPVSRFDCGAKCAPLNGGEPVCCSTDNAVPVMQKSEWKLLKARTDMWHPYKPNDAVGRAIVADLHKSCCAIECNGAAHCERDNRSMACRSFPFFPYVTRDNLFIGISVYWTFEDRCWMINNLNVVDRKYKDEFIQAYETLFADDPGEFDVFRDHSANMRRVFTRWERPIPLIGRDGKYYEIFPRAEGWRQTDFPEGKELEQE
ncbi:MAG: hypothetical protein HQ504_12130 [Rhodospirillaceae bacterium]|nr:hypothetical protein [Rhodospirillaceae bacterium]